MNTLAPHVHQEVLFRPREKLDLSSVSMEALCAEVERRQPAIQSKLRIQWEVVPDREFYAELGRRRQAKRKVHRGGPGRPMRPRCACGRFTLDAARRKEHVCDREAG